MRATLVYFILAIGTFAASATAQTNWVAQVFPERTFDFGKVARGSQLRHSFPIVNSTNQVIRIQSWRTKCGCTQVRAGAMVIPPGAQTFVEATLDTTRFEGPKSSGLTLVLDQPQPLEIELGLNSYIESALVLNPGLVDFGTVMRSSKPKVQLSLSYNGANANWRVTQMKTVSAALNARLEEVGQTASGGIQYRLIATLDPQALREGRYKDEITLITNDPNIPQVPVSVTGRIQSAVTLSPSTLDLGTLKAGQTAERTVLVRAATPFQILEADVVSGQCEVPALTEDSKPLHVLKLTFKAPSDPGPSHTIMEFKTNVPGEPPVRLTAFSNVTP